MKLRVAEYNVNPSPVLRVAHIDFYLSQSGEYICVPFTKGELEFANQLAFEISRVSKEDKNNTVIKEKEQKIYDISEKLLKLTDAIDNFLNDTREKESVEALEQAMKDYGISSIPEGQP